MSKLTISEPAIETNELSKNAMGGTELMLHALHENVSKDLLDNFKIIPSRFRGHDPARKSILWLHDLPNDPEAEKLNQASFRDEFAGLVFVSNWQMQAFNLITGVPYGGKATVLQNAIRPFGKITKPDTKKIRLIYHTTPHRGLALLIPVFEKLQEIHDDIELDIYSSFKIYGWEERDEPYKALFERAKANPSIRYHGSVSNEEVREALAQAHIFAYPCIWPETSCIAAIEAFAAGCIVVHPNYAALPETAGNFGWMYQWSENAQEHANRFANMLNRAIATVKEDYSALQTNNDYQQEYFNHFYSWDVRKVQWTTFLEGVQNGRY